jgi:hypothetical protein
MLNVPAETTSRFLSLMRRLKVHIPNELLDGVPYEKGILVLKEFLDDLTGNLALSNIESSMFRELKNEVNDLLKQDGAVIALKKDDHGRITEYTIHVHPLNVKLSELIEPGKYRWNLTPVDTVVPAEELERLWSTLLDIIYEAIDATKDLSLRTASYSTLEKVVDHEGGHSLVFKIAEADLDEANRPPRTL